MATKTITQFTDDLDGSTENVGTVKFALFGTSYEIDLSKDNQSKLEDALEPFLNGARKASSTSAPSRRASGSKSTSSASPDAKAVRVWAAANNITVPARGRIPGAVIEQFQAAGN